MSVPGYRSAKEAESIAGEAEPPERIARGGIARAVGLGLIAGAADDDPSAIWNVRQRRRKAWAIFPLDRPGDVSDDGGSRLSILQAGLGFRRRLIRGHTSALFPDGFCSVF